MATRSAIIQKQTDGSYRGIYCHWDGYPSNNGKILMEHYTDPVKVSALIDLGDISVLDAEVEPKGPHTYDTPEKGVTVAYHRDRGEEFNHPSVGQTSKAVADQIDHQYAYVFEDGVWHVNGELLADVLASGKD